MAIAPIVILTVSILLQTAAAILAVRLIRITGQRLAWGLIALAAIIMGLRRVLALANIVFITPTPKFDYGAEILALVISAILAAGMALIAPFFASMQRKQKELLETQGALAEAQRVAQVGSWERNVRSDEVWWSDEHFRIYGIDPGAVQPSYFAFLNGVHPDDRAYILRELESAGNDRRPYDAEYRIVRPDGTIRFIHAQGATIFDENGMPIRMRGTIQDITDRIRADEKLATSEKHLRVLIENALDLICLLSDDTTIQFASPSFERTMGYEISDLVGHKVYEFVHPDDLALLRELHRRVLRSPNCMEHVEMRFRHADGSWHALDSIVRNLLDEPAVAAVVVNSRDITDRIAMEDQLRQAQKMEVVGQLTGGIAHDFNNILSVILGNLEVLEERVQDDSGLCKLIRPAAKAAERGALLTARLLAFSRRQALQPRVVNLNDVTFGMVDLLRRTLGEAIAIETTGGAGLWSCEVDPTQLENAILNLAINARDAMPSGGKLTIETTNARLDDDYAAAQADVLPGHYVALSVSDTGTGMTPQVLKRAFEPFFTTKEVGKGTGLGLSMVYGFVKQSRGHVTIYSELNRGTTVRLYFPRVRSAVAESRPSEGGRADYFARGETILVVEDDPDVRSLAVTLLTDLGYTVLEAGHGRAALDLLAENSRVNLLLTDVVLPGEFTGDDLALEAQKVRPGIRVVYMSGYTEKAVTRQGRVASGEIMLQKPFRRAELAQKLRQALDPDHAS